MSRPKNAIKKSYLDLNENEVESILTELGESPFRAEQIENWIYNQGVVTWSEMENLPQLLREKLENIIPLHPLRITKISGSDTEFTRKFLFETLDGQKIESVLMKDGKRTTICISSQVGCAVDCKFCATASMGFIKNLSSGEIVDQVIHLQAQSNSKITNVVFMGMGEPFLNYRNVMEAAKILNQKMGYGARRITISTAGIVPKIRQMANEGHKYKLAISLNGSNEKSRNTIMPLTKTHSLKSLIDSAHYYYKKIHRFITFEYVLLEGVNDSPEDGERLIDLLRSLPCKVNVIPYNEIGGEYNRPNEDNIHGFLHSLKDAPFTVTVRWSKGTDIDAGCGQLAVRDLA
ncbi:MAG: 23S rRNA (adenine(2503)-C(2))-methyltransferase RlmN [Candidatus Marinimicrobia bacterium]|nr:23S rRNA (adenine(2503)-C(2))-methyltransferase RlmN [Candidatus Neomarinimicrobiota bacterium]MBL7029953.1 23S rRNA (adenine(2503)-C(2))-methyltransferase RlmN [Candidatus Neomarinimicrobiota bacterium]